MLQSLLDRPIAFHRPFVKLGVGVNGALMLSQAIYWSGRTDERDGWFYKTQVEWEEETGLTRYEQEGARRKLISLGLMEELKKGVPCKLYYRVSIENLYESLFAENQQTGLLETSELDCGKPAIWLAENQQPITESTKETTTEITKQAPRSRAAQSMMADAEKLKALGVEEQVAIDWLAIRKKKRAPLTDTAIKALIREAEKAGLSVGSAVQISAENGWSGFKASWDFGAIDEEPEIFAEVVEAYNRICGGVFTLCAGKTKVRVAQVLGMLNLEFMGGKPFSNGIHIWEQYFSDCLANKYWRGENENGWVADFDFVTKPANAIKLMERMN